MEDKLVDLEEFNGVHNEVITLEQNHEIKSQPTNGLTSKSISDSNVDDPPHGHLMVRPVGEQIFDEIYTEHETQVIKELVETLVRETSTKNKFSLELESSPSCQAVLRETAGRTPQTTTEDLASGESLKAGVNLGDEHPSLVNIESKPTTIAGVDTGSEIPSISQFANEDDIEVKSTCTEAETSCVVYPKGEYQMVDSLFISTSEVKDSTEEKVPKIVNKDSLCAQINEKQCISQFTPILDDTPSTPEQLSQPISRASPTHTLADDDKLSKFKALAVKLKKDLAKSRDEVRATNDKLVNLSQKMSAAEKENTRVTLLYSQQSLQSEYDRILDDYETIKKKFRLHAQQKSDDGIKDLKIQLDKKTNIIYELESKLADIQLQVEQKDQLKSKLRDLTETIQSTEKKYHSTLRELELLRSELSKVSIASTTYEDDCAQLSKQLSILQQTLEAERVNHEKLRLSFESKVQCLKQQLKSSEDDLHTLNLEFEKYKSKVSQLMQNTNLVQANSIRTYEQEKMKQLKTSNEDLKNQISTLRQELNDVNCIKNELDERTQELKVSQETKNDISQFNSQLQESLKKIQTENQQLKSSLEQLEISQHNPKISSIAGTNTDSDAETTMKHDDISNLDNLSGDELTKELNSILFPNSNGLLEYTKHSASSIESRLNSSNFIPSDKDSSSYRFGQQSEPSYAHVSLPMKGAPLEILGGTSSILNDAHNQIDNLTQAYLESEKTNKLLADQVTALKEEIRRLQRGNERLDLAENLEYLKNIVIKFVSLEGSDEKQRLIPVLSTMLKLSPQEQSKLQSATQSNDKGGFFRII